MHVHMMDGLDNTVPSHMPGKGSYSGTNRVTTGYLEAST